MAHTIELRPELCARKGHRGRRGRADGAPDGGCVEGNVGVKCEDLPADFLEEIKLPLRHQELVGHDAEVARDAMDDVEQATAGGVAEDVDAAVDMVAEYVNAKGAELREVYEQGVDDGAEPQAAGPQSAEQQCRALSRKVLSRKPSGRRVHSCRAEPQSSGRGARSRRRKGLSRPQDLQPQVVGGAPTGR